MFTLIIVIAIVIVVVFIVFLFFVFTRKFIYLLARNKELNGKENVLFPLKGKNGKIWKVERTKARRFYSIEFLQVLPQFLWIEGTTQKNK